MVCCAFDRRKVRFAVKFRRWVFRSIFERWMCQMVVRSCGEKDLFKGEGRLTAKAPPAQKE